LTANNVSDTVNATGIWATQTAFVHDTATAASVIADPRFTDMTTPPKDRLNLYGGTGLRPIDNTIGVRNVMLMQFQVQPAAVWHQRDVNFDITRQISGFGYVKPTQNANWQVDSGLTKYVPRQVEEANDDPTPDVEESRAPTAGDGYMYRHNFREWLRITFEAQPIEGHGVRGSRASDYYDWHVAHTLQNQNGAWVRTTGDNPEQAGVNSIGPGHIYTGLPQ
jgi:hypothetical protein